MTRVTFPLVRVALLIGLAGTSACVPASDGASARFEQPIIHGDDGRSEYFGLDSEGLRSRIALSTAALIPNEWLDHSARALSAEAPTLAADGARCPSERFVGQPSAAFCTAVLVERDLVLTAGHCVRLLKLADFSVVFGYYYREPGLLGLADGLSISPVEIESESLDPAGSEPRFDHAWVRLAEPVPPPFEPVPIYRATPDLQKGEAVFTIGAPSGVPLKADGSGVVVDARSGSDYFAASTDTSRGWSGGGAFDSRLALLGVLARGASDFVDVNGCQQETRADPAIRSDEHFSYAHAALPFLCAARPDRKLCQVDCGEPCEVETATAHESADFSPGPGCGIARAPATPSYFWLFLTLGRWRRRQRGFEVARHGSRKNAGSP